MKSTRIFIFTVCLVLAAGAAMGQIVQLNSEGEFSPQRISLDFNSLQEGARATDLFAT